MSRHPVTFGSRYPLLPLFMFPVRRTEIPASPQCCPLVTRGGHRASNANNFLCVCGCMRLPVLTGLRVSRKPLKVNPAIHSRTVRESFCRRGLCPLLVHTSRVVSVYPRSGVLECSTQRAASFSLYTPEIHDLRLPYVFRESHPRCAHSVRLATTPWPPPHLTTSEKIKRSYNAQIQYIEK